MPSVYVIIFAVNHDATDDPTILTGIKNNICKFWKREKPKTGQEYVKNNPLQEVFPGGNTEGKGILEAAAMELLEETGVALEENSLKLPRTTTISSDDSIPLISLSFGQSEAGYSYCFLEVSNNDITTICARITRVINDDDLKVRMGNYVGLCRCDDELSSVNTPKISVYRQNITVIPNLGEHHHKRPYQGIDWFQNISIKLIQELNYRQQIMLPAEGIPQPHLAASLPPTAPFSNHSPASAASASSASMPAPPLPTTTTIPQPGAKSLPHPPTPITTITTIKVAKKRERDNDKQGSEANTNDDLLSVSKHEKKESTKQPPSSTRDEFLSGASPFYPAIGSSFSQQHGDPNQSLGSMIAPTTPPPLLPPPATTPGSTIVTPKPQKLF
jgi:hypothetical protein